MTIERKKLVDVLSDGELHPIMSPLKIRKGEPTNFWISEKSEKLFCPEDQTEADCYLVQGYKSEKWIREGLDLRAVGRVAMEGIDIRIGFQTNGDFGYIYNPDALEVRVNELNNSKKPKLYQRIYKPDDGDPNF